MSADTAFELLSMKLSPNYFTLSKNVLGSDRLSHVMNLRGIFLAGQVPDNCCLPSTFNSN